MGWFPRFGKSSSKAKIKRNSYEKLKKEVSDDSTAFTSEKVDGMTEIESLKESGANVFSFSELAAATKKFRQESYLRRGRSGGVYKGRLKSINQVVAIKQVDLDRSEGNRKFIVEVLMLSRVHHPNLVNLIGYCADGDHQLIVQEFMPLGSLKDNLHDLDWNTRMKIAVGVAKGLQYLHNEANPPVIFRDLTSSNISLDEGYQPKLSDFGWAKLGPVHDSSSSQVCGAKISGYVAPEEAMTGISTLKSDVYSFGVVLLEIITGKKVIDHSRPAEEQFLVYWAKPLFKRRAVKQLVDPMLKGHYPTRRAYQALCVAVECVHLEQPKMRPVIAEVVAALDYIASETYNLDSPPDQNSTSLLPQKPPRTEQSGTIKALGFVL